MKSLLTLPAQLYRLACITKKSPQISLGLTSILDGLKLKVSH